VTDNATTEATGRVADETRALLQAHPRPEPATLLDALCAMSELARESAALVAHGARGVRLDLLDVAALQQRHAWLAVRLPRFADGDTELTARFTTAAADAVTSWLTAHDRAVRVGAGWHPDETRPPTHELRWWPSMFGQPEKWRLTTAEGSLIGELAGPHALGETELRAWAALHLPGLQVTNLLDDAWMDPTSTDPGPEDVWCPVFHVHTAGVLPECSPW
jgi:hypothetical protein